MNIVEVDAYPILDSRGVPTLEATVRLEDGSIGRGAVPSGASTGKYEALQLRDGDPQHFQGKGVLRAVAHVKGEICAAMVGRDANLQESIDEALVGVDGTPDKSRLGANAILGVSMAVANAAARSQAIPLFELLGSGSGTLLPMPQIQMIGGGAHADWRLDIQDLLIIPLGADSFWNALSIASDVYRSIGRLLDARGTRFGVADEGGYWPSFATNEAAIELLAEGIVLAGYKLGSEVAIALDVAASELFDCATGRYRLALDGVSNSSEEIASLLSRWVADYKIASIEDPMADDDLEGWKIMNGMIGEKCQLIGDDLFTTNLSRIRDGVSAGVANAVLIKLNQIGTVSETIRAIHTTQMAGWSPIVSARSGETEDAFIAHLAVASNAGQLKVGSIARSERTAKWNEVLRIERLLGNNARFSRGPVQQR